MINSKLLTYAALVASAAFLVGCSNNSENNENKIKRLETENTELKIKVAELEFKLEALKDIETHAFQMQECTEYGSMFERALYNYCSDDGPIDEIDECIEAQYGTGNEIKIVKMYQAIDNQNSTEYTDAKLEALDRSCWNNL